MIHASGLFTNATKLAIFIFLILLVLNNVYSMIHLTRILYLSILLHLSNLRRNEIKLKQIEEQFCI